MGGWTYWEKQLCLIVLRESLEIPLTERSLKTPHSQVNNSACFPSLCVSFPSKSACHGVKGLLLLGGQVLIDHTFLRKVLCYYEQEAKQIPFLKSSYFEVTREMLN